MSDNNLVGLSDKRSYLQVLGCLMRNPLELENADRPLSKSDFSTEKFYQIIYVTIFNLYQRGVEKIDEYAIDSYLKDYTEQYKIFTENKGLEWISSAIEMAELSNYEYYYHRLRKFSMLREYEKKGLDTSFIYNRSLLDNADENMKFDSYTEQDIADIVEASLVIDIKNDYCNAYAIDSGQAGDGMLEMIEELRQIPDYGYPLTSLAFNTAARGGRRGKLYLISAGTGSGKTRRYLKDACTIAVPYVYDEKKKDFIYTGNDTPCLYIGTEGSRAEFMSILAASVSLVDEDHILMGQYEDGEYERVKKAEEYISASPLFLVYCDEFTIGDIENIIKRYVIQKGIKVAIFDYIQTTAKMTGDLSSRARIKLQEYQILIQFAGRLKALAEKLDILILSGSQLRPDAKEQRYKDETTLQGAKGMAQKCDVGAVISRPTPSEKKKIEKITKNMLGCPEVNSLFWIYKVRRGRLVSIIIHQHVDLGRMTIQDLFVTDFDFNLIDVDFTKIEQMDKVVEEKSRKLELDKLSDEEATEVPKDDDEEDEVVENKFDW